MAGQNEKNPCFRAPIRKSSGVYRREFYAFFPDPLFMQFLQEFSIGHGVGGSQPGLNLGFVWEFWGNGGWGGARLGGFLIGKRGFLRVILRGCERWGTGFFPLLIF